MPPEHPHETEQEPPEGKSSTGIRKRKKTAAPSRSTAIRNSSLCSSLTGDLPPTDHIQPQVESPVASSVAEANPQESVRLSSKIPEILGECPQTRGRKRKRELEDEDSDNRRQGHSPPTDKPAVAIKPLNKKNLKELNKLNRRKDPEVQDEMPQNKRSRSQSSITGSSEDNITTVSASSQKSSISLSNYRLKILQKQQIVFEHGPMSEQLQTCLDLIFQSPIAEDDMRGVTSIAQSLCDDFATVLRTASREDASVNLICHALESMNKNLLDQVFNIQLKASWDPTLKPTINWQRYSSFPPANTPNELSKERQPYITPDGSATTMPPPPIPPKQQSDGVKNPCPDITLGLHHHVVSAKLESVGIPWPHSERLLVGLEDENALKSCPAQSALLLRFPSLIVEGKSYDTGKTIYEAQNQAAVSGSMMLVIQHQLSELAGSKAPNSPLAFSICSEGPIIELWVHFNTYRASSYFYKMRFLRICHASALDTVVEFFLAVLRIMRWTKLTLLDDVAEKLLHVWKSSQNIIE